MQKITLALCAAVLTFIAAAGFAADAAPKASEVSPSRTRCSFSSPAMM